MSRVQWSCAQRWKNDAIFLGVRVGIGLATSVLRSWLPALGAALGMAAFAMFGGARKTTFANLALAGSRATSPDAPLRAPELASVARAIFRRLGQNLTDTVALLDPTEEPDRTLGITPASRVELEAALAEGRGVIYATCHLGPWERMAALLAKLGYPITTLARESYDARFHGLVYDRLRTGRNIEVIYRSETRAPIAIVRALRRRRVLGFLVDLPGRSANGAAVDWLGRASRMAPGPARLALRTGCPVVIGTPAPGPDGLYVRIARLPTRDLDPTAEGEAALCQRIADALSDRIRELPTDWPWMHPSFGSEADKPAPRMP